MELVVLLLVVTCLSTLYFAWRYKSVQRTLSECESELISANRSLGAKEWELHLAAQKQIDYFFANHSLEAASWSLKEKCASLKRDNSTILRAYTSLKVENALLESKNSFLHFLEPQNESLKSENSALLRALEAAKESLESRCRLLADREKAWQSEKDYLHDLVRHPLQRVEEMAKKLKASEKANRTNQLRVVQLMMLAYQVRRGKPADLSSLKPQIEAFQARDTKLHADNYSNIVSFLLFATEQRLDSILKSAEGKYSALLAQFEQLKSDAQQERSAMQQELMTLEWKLADMSTAANQCSRRCVKAKEQYLKLQSVLQDSNRHVQALKERLSLRTTQGAECVVCLDRQRRILFEPCSHICACERCSKNLRKCPLCKSDILHRKSVFL